MSTFRNRSIALIFTLVMVTFLSACQQASTPKIAVSSAWGRSSASMATTGAVYMVIENQGNQADRLVGATSAAAKTVEIHETSMNNNVMSMHPLQNGLEIPAGGKVELKSGGYHVMLVDLAKPLETGSKITLTLKFEKSGEIKVDAEVRAQ
jgi:periplasmic copper chaperone A